MVQQFRQWLLSSLKDKWKLVSPSAERSKLATFMGAAQGKRYLRSSGDLYHKGMCPQQASLSNFVTLSPGEPKASQCVLHHILESGIPRFFPSRIPKKECVSQAKSRLPHAVVLVSLVPDLLGVLLVRQASIAVDCVSEPWIGRGLVK